MRVPAQIDKCVRKINLRERGGRGGINAGIRERFNCNTDLQDAKGHQTQDQVLRVCLQ